MKYGSECPFCHVPVTLNVGPPVEYGWEIVKEVAAEHGLTLGELQARNRHKGIFAARVCAARRLRDAGFLLKEIGVFLKRDHSTVIHALRLPHEHLSTLLSTESTQPGDRPVSVRIA